jgi:hypothetical protein
LIVHHLRLFTFILVPILILTAVQLAAAKPADAPVIGPNHNAYRTIETYLNWHDARNYCSSLGGHLVTLNSQEENDFVYQLLDWGWLGGTDEQSEGAGAYTLRIESLNN